MPRANWTVVNIKQEWLEGLKEEAEEHDRTPPEELQFILRKAGIKPRKPIPQPETVIPEAPAK